MIQDSHCKDVQEAQKIDAWKKLGMQQSYIKCKK
jgi:hypothetical protein